MSQIYLAGRGCTVQPPAAARTSIGVLSPVPIVNSELDETMEFAHSPSNLSSGAKPSSALGRRHRGELQISNRPEGGEPGIAAPTRCPTSLGEAAEADHS